MTNRGDGKATSKNRLLFVTLIVTIGVILAIGLVSIFARDDSDQESEPAIAHQSGSFERADLEDLLSAADPTDEEKHDAIWKFCIDTEAAATNPGCLIWSNSCTTTPDPNLTGDPAEDCQVAKTEAEYCISDGWCGNRVAHERWLALRQQLEELGLQDESQPFPNPSHPSSPDYDQIRRVYIEHKAIVIVPQSSLVYYFVD